LGGAEKKRREEKHLNEFNMDLHGLKRDRHEGLSSTGKKGCRARRIQNLQQRIL
jgi:hypothetical protein